MIHCVKQNSTIFLNSALALSVFSACGPTSHSTQYSRLTNLGVNGLVSFVVNSDNPTDVEKIIGANDLEQVNADGTNIPEKYRSQLDAYGKISMGCTATHIGNGFVLTAGHCFDAPSARAGDLPCSNITVEWGVRGNRDAYLKSKCVKVLAAELSNDRDYAIFLVSPAPTVAIPVDFNARITPSSKITIFGHPRMRPLEWSKVCTVEPSSQGPWGKDQFSHQCDTEPGNSGSAVIDDTTLKVIGIHDGGKSTWNYATFISDTPVAEFLPAETSDRVPGALPINERR